LSYKNKVLCKVLKDKGGSAAFYNLREEQSIQKPIVLLFSNGAGFECGPGAFSIGCGRSLRAFGNLLSATLACVPQGTLFPLWGLGFFAYQQGFK
jgi:hypothetical protein